ncbi:hypothetical protein C0J52_05728 [Blattella germanica]|nr:hypothetical protein C0J52_05728 [Blattella germanica]
MIVLFHTFFRVTRYILTVISKSILCRIRSNDGKEDSSVSRNISSYCTPSEADLEGGADITFFPPVYIQRYVAVQNVLNDERWLGKIRKAVDFGCAELSLFVFMKHLDGLEEFLAVDVDSELLERYCCRAAPMNADFLDPKRQKPLTVSVLNGSIADTDPRLLGSDAVICIELIEHLYPNTLEDVPYTVFGYIQPMIAIFTTPNSDFNVLFPNFSGFRHDDHKFEWSRSQFEEWAHNIATRYPTYTVNIVGIGEGPPGTESLGCCSQMAVFVKVNFQDHIQCNGQKDCKQNLKPEESELVYSVIRTYEHPFHIDHRTDEQKILHEAEYYMRKRCTDDQYSSVCRIPLSHILPWVKKWTDSISKLKSVLQDARWEILEDSQIGETCVVFHDSNEDSSYSEVEDFDVDVEASTTYVYENMENDWDLPNVGQVEQDDHQSHNETALHNIQTQCSENLVHSEQSPVCENTGLDSENSTSKSALQICEEGSVLELSDAENNYCRDNVNCERTRTVVGNSDKSAVTNSQHINTRPLNRVDNLLEHDSEIVSAPVSACKIERSSEDKLTRQDLNSAFGHVAQQLKNESCSYNEALKRCEADEFESVNEISSFNLCSEHDGKNRNFPGDPLLYQNPHCLISRQQTLQPQTLNVNLSDPTKVNLYTNCKFDRTVDQPSSGETDDILPDSAAFPVAQPKMSQSLNFGCATPSTQELSQDRSLGESCSLDEQNDKAVDSGYPNSYSVQDMDMDLTPEQVDEISSESEDIPTEHSSSCSGDSDSESLEGNNRVDENNHDHNRFINNDGFVFRLRQELLYDPMAHAVENGDVANNNRDGEGNNAVAILPVPPDPEIIDQIDHEIIPLLAAVEDFDNDNDVILAEDVHPFPHWLLNLLGLANAVNGGGDLQNYLPPAALPVNIPPDEGLGDDDEDEDDIADVHGSNSSDVGEAGSDFDGSEIGLGSEEEFPQEVVVPGDVGGGGEPDTFQGNQ